jgi:hypothetical protein
MAFVAAPVYYPAGGRGQPGLAIGESADFMKFSLLRSD